MVGIITPHDDGFALKVTEKIEDLVTILFLPIYFAFSGVKTQLGVLDDAVSWGLVVLVFSTACLGKIVGCGLAAKFSGFTPRESLTMGLLMNSKGLVEIIVLNIGREAKIIDDRIFSIFIIMALLTTFMTVPLVALVYPFSSYIKKDTADVKSIKGDEQTTAFMICLTEMRSVPAMMNMTQLLSKRHTSQVHALRLVELGERMSNLMMAKDGDTIHQDPIMNVFR